MRRTDLNSPELFINRELSWLEFNDRVLREGLADDVPLIERLKFLSIVSSNLDEYFMIRVAGLRQQVKAGVISRGISGLSPAEQLEKISQRVHRMAAEQSAGIRAAFKALAEQKLVLLEAGGLDAAQHRFIASYFSSEILPVLTPLAVDEAQPPPILPGLSLNLALKLAPPGEDAPQERLAVVPIPGRIGRFIPLPDTGGLMLVRIEDVIAMNVARLFAGWKVLAITLFRITRDADIAIEDEDAADLLQVIEEAVRQRRRRDVVRLELSAKPDARLRSWLTSWFEVAEQDVYEIDGMLDAASLMELVSKPGFTKLRDPDWPPQQPRDLAGHADLWQAAQDHDVMLFHPYESFEAIIRFLELAANDPNVLAIKQTLYRTSPASAVIAALARAAENGKHVTVLVELKARFDETRNVEWARKLEDAGCHVIYGVAGLKTHAKILLVIRRETRGIRRYVHLSTGNYNERTAKIYSDIGLLTSDRDIAADASAFFNLLTGYSQQVEWSKFVLSPPRPSAGVSEPDRARNPRIHARSPRPDHGQDQLAARPGHLQGPLRGKPGGRADNAQRARDVHPPPPRRRCVGQHRRDLYRRPLP